MWFFYGLLIKDFFIAVKFMPLSKNPLDYNQANWNILYLYDTLTYLQVY